MAVFTAESARANVRVRDGKRVFYLAEGDHLTPSARDWLRRDGVEILPARAAKPNGYRTLTGAVYVEKPEHMTHLAGDVLVEKTHPRIAFRGGIDALEAALLLAGREARAAEAGETERALEEVLTLVRRLIRCDVLEEPLPAFTLGGLTASELRQHSHFPQKYYDQPHFMPDFGDSRLLLTLNQARTQARWAELLACRAFRDSEGRVTRPDLIQALNRVSSLLWILMIRRRKEERAV